MANMHTSFAYTINDKYANMQIDTSRKPIVDLVENNLVASTMAQLYLNINPIKTIIILTHTTNQGNTNKFTNLQVPLVEILIRLKPHHAPHRFEYFSHLSEHTHTHTQSSNPLSCVATS